jgi:hypothetical protein
LLHGRLSIASVGGDAAPIPVLAIATLCTERETRSLLEIAARDADASKQNARGRFR